MSSDVALQALTQLVFVLVFILTVLELARRRDRARLEIALLFGSLAVIIVIQGFTQLTGISSREAALVGALLLLANPYLLVRLVAHFRPLPRIQHAIGLVYVAVSWAVILANTALAGQQLPRELTLLVVVPFAYLEGYAAVAFVRSALTSRGVTHHRLVAAALGSGFLALAILIAGVTAFTGTNPAIKTVTALLSLGSAVSYYVGFAPPAWLRRAWQMAEFRAFLAGLAGQSPEDRFSAALDRLGAASARAVGGKGALIFLGDDSATTLRLYPDPEKGAALVAAGLDTLELGEPSPTCTTAWHERRSVIAESPFPRFAGAFGGASKALVSPLIAYGRRYGLLIVLFDQQAVFFRDEMELVSMMADQAAFAIAGQQLLERLEQQNAALEAASRLKSEFLANMSHELRTPLNAILGFSELLMDDGGQPEDAEMRATYLERIHASGEHLLALINDILDLSKVEAGRMELHPDNVAPGDVVDQVVNTLQPLADRKNIALAASVDGTGDVFADVGKLKQILYNLLSNAIKFTPECGRVDVEIRPAAEAGMVEFVVSDTGIGIAPEDQERVFLEFQQVDGGADRRYEGTGLGLALTKRFVELHGGRIWLESTPGQGSRFHVALPRASGQQPMAPLDSDAAAAPAEPRGGATGPLVVVIEDDAAAAHLLSVYLSRGGYRAEIARDGRSGLELARALRPAAITLDVMLPGMDGWEVMRALKADPVTRDIPVLIASVVDNEPLGYALGATDYLVKPIDRELLLSKLAACALTPQTAHRELTVLAVDDDPAALDLIAGMLEPLGYNVLRASGGAEALAITQMRRPDALLLDLMMPEVTGFDVVAALRLDPATRKIPIFIITAKDLTDEDRAVLRGQVAAVFQKGALRAADLRQAIAAALDVEGQPQLEPAGA